MWHPILTMADWLGDRSDRIARFRSLAVVAEAQDSKDWGDDRARIGKLIEAGKSSIPTANDLLSLEATLIRVSPDQYLLEWRQYFEEEYCSIMQCEAAPKVTAQDAALRASVISLSARVQRLRAVRRGLGVMRTLILGGALFSASIFFCFASRCLGLFDGANPWEPLTLIVILAGILGGFVSGVSRLYSLQWSGEILLQTASVPALGCGLALNLLLAVLEGGVFALMLYLLFASKLLQGSLFPEFFADRVTATAVNFSTFMNTGPASDMDVGKAIFWAFVAGFSERFVPDLIGQLAGNAKMTVNSSQTNQKGK